HDHHPRVVRYAEVPHVDQAIKITCGEELRVANSLALWPAQHSWAGTLHQLGNYTTHRAPTLLLCTAIIEHLSDQEAATASRHSHLGTGPVPGLTDVGQGLAALPKRAGSHDHCEQR